MKAGVVDGNGIVLARLQQKVGEHAAQRTSARVVALLAECSHRVVAMANLTMADISSIGIGSPGILDTKNGIVIAAANFTDWKNVEITKLLSKKLSKPVKLENDANAALLAETWVGAAKGKTDVIMVTLGTGIGGGVMVNGDIARGGSGTAGEIGHIIIKDNGRQCGCGSKGCWETYASGRGVARSAKENKGLCQAFPQQELEAKQVFDLADQNHPDALRVVENWAGAMSLGIIALARVIDPQVVILGGGVAQNPHIIPAVVKAFDKRTWRFDMGRPSVRKAEVGNDAGLIGAAYVGRSLITSQSLGPSESSLTHHSRM